MPFCEYCGKEISYGANYCSHCGRRTKHSMDDLLKQSQERYKQTVADFLEDHKNTAFYKLLTSDGFTLLPQGHRLLQKELDVKVAKATYDSAIMGNWKSRDKKEERYYRLKAELDEILEDLNNRAATEK